MHIYQREFGKNFNLGFDLKTFSFLDNLSFHLDECPSFVFHSLPPNDKKYLLLWVENKDISMIGCDFPRYSVLTATNFGTVAAPEIVHDENSKILFASEDVKALYRFLAPFQMLDALKVS
ncbi:hypothetical protein [Shewanella surugensis]|uniref:Uncharacterized protein n=1 Tax=Shewanella surugensis TaxID=212020 RepID=A0ABT0LAQ1_9GAMM|nr:hypothetical protein [Shewanella surugensis]MCL1124644.1 hypothetical protein [Shewanella surugensis]